MRTAIAVYLLILSVGALFAQPPENIPQFAATDEFGPGGGGPSLPPAAAKESLWTASVEVTQMIGSVAGMSIAAWPGEISHMTCAGLAFCDFPVALHSSSMASLDLIKATVCGVYDGLTEIVHWASIPLYFIRHLLQQLPEPELPWESENTIFNPSADDQPARQLASTRL